MSAEKPGGLAEHSLRATLGNLDIAAQDGPFACPDTGFPLFYIRVGDGIQVESGYSAIDRISAEAVAAATLGNHLRKTMVHPLTRFNPGTNVIQHMPHVTLK